MKIVLITLILIVVTMQENLFATDIPVTPYPQSVEIRDASFSITVKSKIVLGDGSTEAEEFLSGMIRNSIRNILNVELKIVRGDKQYSSGDIFLGLSGSRGLASDRIGDRMTADMEKEGYILESDGDGLSILASASAGLFYGGMTLLQLIENSKTPETIPGLTIIDYPAFKFRGISDDISRGQVSTLENFKEIIRRLARYKQNVYMPYLEDLFRFESHPLIGKNRGALTREQVEELDAYARKYHVEIIPIFQTLGHMENMLLMPEYLGYADFPGAASLNVGDERIYDLLREFFDEIVPAFSSKYFHMAADESWDVGRGASRSLVEETSIAEVHARHFIRVYNMLKDMGKEVMMYADIATGLGDALPGHPEVLDQLPDDIIMVYWDYGARSSFTDRAKIFPEAGQPFIVSPAVWNWHRIYPDNLTAPINIRNMAHTGVETGAVGFINSSWGDYGGESFRELNWFGYAYGAEVSWSPGHDALDGFTHNFLRDFYGTNDVRLKTVYSLLANIGNKFTNEHLWRPPFMPPPGTTSWNLSPQFLINFNQMKQDVPVLHTLLDELIHEGVVTRNNEHLDYLRFSVVKAELLVRKIESAEYLSQFQSVESITGEELHRALRICREMIAKTERLRESFVTLWLRTNIDANLENLLAHYYRRQISYWREMTGELQRGTFWVDHENPGKFIYHPDATPYVSSGTRKPHVYFRKSFTVDNIETVERMMVQTVGDTYLKIYVNGREVGESNAKRALSLIVQMARTRFWDIADYLVDGENVIAVEARNYLHAGSAGLSWYSEVLYDDEMKKGIYSDESWKVTDTVEDGWYTTGYDDTNWQNGRIVEERVPLIDRPNFEHGRKSWIIDRVWTATLED